MGAEELFFKVPEGQDPYDYYEECLFEEKKYFRTKPILKPIFNGRLNKVRLRQSAVLSLFPSFEILEDLQLDLNFTVQTNLNDNFAYYQSLKNKGYLAIYNAESFHQLIKIVEQLVDLQQSFCRYVYANLGQQHQLPSELLLSKETDAMELAQGLRFFKEQGGLTLQDAFNFDYSGKEAVTLELNRLFLQCQKEGIHE